MKLHLGITKGDIKTIKVNSYKEIIAEISKRTSFFKDKVMIATVNGEHRELIITEDLNRIMKLLVTDYFGEINDFFLFDHNTWEEAYKVALDMREPCINCYNK